MLARLGSGLALAAVAALALVGCSPPEPVATTPAAEPTVEPTLSDEELESDAREAFEDFYAVIDAQFAARTASAEAFGEVATPEVADTWASAIQTTLDRGDVSRGVLEITAITLADRTTDGFVTELCTDGRGIETTDAQGLVKPPSGLVAWSASFEYTPAGGLVVAGLDPVQEQSICGE